MLAACCSIDPLVEVNSIWQSAWIFAAGVLEALLHGLPELVRRGAVDGEDDLQGIGERRSREGHRQSHKPDTADESVHERSPRICSRRILAVGPRQIGS